MSKRSIEALTEAIKRVLKWRSLEVGIELNPGDIRFPDSDHPVTMTASYGHIRGYVGADGEALDCYLGGALDSPNIFQIHQLTLDGEYDEDKYMLGYLSAKDAKKAYLAHMPKEMFGGIFQTSLGFLKSLKKVKEEPSPIDQEEENKFDFVGTWLASIGLNVKECNESRGYIVTEYVTTEDGQQLAKKVRSLVAPGYDQKTSKNSFQGKNRHYLDDPVKASVEYLSKRINAGEIVYSNLGHSNGLVDSETGEPAGYNVKSLPRLSKLIAVWMDDESGEVYCDDEFIYDTPLAEILTQEEIEKSKEWAAKAYKGEWLPRSWRAIASCPLPRGTGDCEMLDLDGIDWLDPETEEPGFDIAEQISVLENKQCNDDCECDPCTTKKQSANNLEQLTTARADISGGNKTSTGDITMEKWQNIIMALMQAGMPKDAVLAELQKLGASQDEINMASQMMDQMMSEKKSEEEKKYAEEQAKKLEEEKKALEAKLAAEKLESEKKIAELAKEKESLGEEFKKLVAESTLNATKEAYKQGLDAALSAIGLNAEDVKAIKEEQEKRKSEADKLNAIESTCTQLHDAALTQKKVGSHDLTNNLLYPASNVKMAVEMVCDDVRRTAMAYDTAIAVLNTELKYLAENCARVNRSNEGFRGTVEADLKDTGAADCLDKIEKAADAHANRMLVGQQRLERRAALAPHIKEHTEFFNKENLSVNGKVLYESARVLNGGRKKSDSSLRDALVESGQITSEAVNTETQLANQAMLSTVVFKRIYGDSDFLRVVAPFPKQTDGMINDYNAADPYSDIGEELRYAVWRGIDPVSDNGLVIDNPGVDPYTQVSTQRKYQSLFTQEMAVEYLWALKTVNSLRSVFGYDELGVVADYLGDLMARRLAAKAYLEIDNIGRQYRLKAVTSEAPAALDMVDTNTLDVIDDFGNTTTLTYDTTTTAILRLKVGQTSVTGTLIKPRLIVRPSVDKKYDRDGVTSTTSNAVVVTLPGGAPTAVEGDLVLDEASGLLKITAKKSGDSPTHAIDYENCLVLFNSASTVTSSNRPTNVAYKWVPRTDDSTNPGNMVPFSLTVPDTKTGAEHYNDLLSLLVRRAAKNRQERKIMSNLAIGDEFVIRGILTEALRWQSQYATVGSSLVTNFDEVNEIGKVGGVTMFGTNAPLAGGAGVIMLTARGGTKYVLANRVERGDIEPVYIDPGSTNAPVKKVSAMRQSWRLTFGFKSPRTINPDTGFADNEPSVLIKLTGTVAGV